MKKSTAAQKLAALLGMEVDTSHYDEESKKKSQKKKQLSPKEIAVQENEIQKFRAIQGLTYFLQAPELFTSKICKHCGEGFLVSRKHVAYCTYTCMDLELQKISGLPWSRWNDLEAVAQDQSVWNGNEPLIIKNLDRIQAVLDQIKDKADA